MINEVQFLLNEKKQRTESNIINFKFIIFTVVFISFVLLNQDRYIGANANAENRMLLGLWLLYPIYLVIFKKFAMKKYMILCTACESPVALQSKYQISADLEQLTHEKCAKCKAVLSLDKLKTKS
ncbi:hypothetical protein PQO03_09795 [Lentisphaera profundi]|uniref:Uncharacterized protein n=1 Tax=Lentisphaera profundi TaxID=1658616 RepID=A0ABY7VPE0_9BACT|nr:hypothetical protein [Lentisphaera profundi]WDE96005.1 hypothetical protein PQO03_09795 [Lentisphaera profundi]